jgi:hypothetical protein
MRRVPLASPQWRNDMSKIAPPPTRLDAKARLGVNMDVLISWSKRRSRELASSLHAWLPRVLPGLVPWMSEKDIDKGTEWFRELQDFLSGAKLCVICVTRENVRSPWLYYEAGAVATKRRNVRICPYLFDLTPSILADGPLGRFQCTVASKPDTLALVRSLNKLLDEAKRDEEPRLQRNFETTWPEFEEELNRTRAMDARGADDLISTRANLEAPSVGWRFFVGQWRVGHGTGMPGTFVITLRDDRTASKSNVPAATGTWEYANGEARIAWSDGWRDILRCVPEGVMKFAYRPGEESDLRPTNTSIAQKTDELE